MSLRRTMRVVLVASCLVYSPPSSAMKCFDVPPEKVAAEAEVVFIGRATLVEYLEGSAKAARKCGGKVVTLNVEQRFKGSVSDTVRVLVDDACMQLGGYFGLDQTFLVVAKEIADPKRAEYAKYYGESVCWGTGDIRRPQAMKVIEYFRQGRSNASD